MHQHRTIVGPRAVYERLNDPKQIVVDCRHTLADFSLGRRLYDEAHVPGAFFADVEADLAGRKDATTGRHPLPDPESFARFLRGLGVDDDTHVVAYDAGADMFAPRLWFLCRWIGHHDVAVMDGGFAAWTALKLPVTAAPSEPSHEGSLHLRLHPQYVVDARHVLDRLEDDEAMHLVDARAADRFAGQNETIDPVAGHIPGARNRWFKENFNADGSLKSPEQLRAEFAALGVDPQRTIHQCGSGVSAAVTHLAMEHAGLSGSRVYGGSWSEWIADPSRPISTGTG